MAELTLRVITPESIPLDTTVTSVRIPGLDGSIGILPRHASMISGLDIGVATYREGGKEKKIFVGGGFAEVRQNTVRLVCQASELPEEIDPERAKAAEQRARERLEGKLEARESIDVERARAALRRALVRQAIAIRI